MIVVPIVMNISILLWFSIMFLITDCRIWHVDYGFSNFLLSPSRIRAWITQLDRKFYCYDLIKKLRWWGNRLVILWLPYHLLQIYDLIHTFINSQKVMLLWFSSILIDFLMNEIELILDSVLIICRTRVLW